MNPCLLVLLVPLVAGSGIPWPWGSNSDDNDPATCPVPDLETTDASIPTPFTPLSKDELEALLGWLYSPDRDLNLTDPWTRNLTVSDNYIWQIEDLKPNKTDVLAYFKDATPVPRYARVVLVEGAKAEPVVTEYFVSPDFFKDVCFAILMITGWSTSHLRRYDDRASLLPLQWRQWPESRHRRPAQRLRSKTGQRGLYHKVHGRDGRHHKQLAWNGVLRER